MRKQTFYFLSFSSLLFAIGLFTHLFEPIVFSWALQIIGRIPKHARFFLECLGWGMLLISAMLFAYGKWILPKEAVIAVKLKSLLKKAGFWVEEKLAPFVDFSTVSENKFKKKINHWDILFVIGALAFSLAYFVERLQWRYPFVWLGSDAGNIASFASALDYPNLFTRDFFLSNPAHFQNYLQLHVLLVRWLGKLFDNYSLGFVSLLAPTTFLFLIALYTMGRTILGNRFWAFLFTLLNMANNHISFDTWGIQVDPAPRTLMQALFPLLITLLWLWKDSPKRWFIIAILTGALAYVHAVGTPTVMVIITLSFFMLAPKDWSFLRKVFTTIGLGLLILTVASGFILNYFDASGRTNENINYDETITLYRTFYPPGILDVKETTKNTFENLGRLWLTQLGFTSAVILFLLHKNKRREVILVLSWLIGIGVVSILIPFTERLVENYLRILPIETELIRGARFFIPVFGLLSLWGLSELARRIKIRFVATAITILGIFFVGHILKQQQTEDFSFRKTAYCLKQGQLFCTLESDFDETIYFLRDKTPDGSTVFFADTPREVMPLAVRYYAHRPLVYSWKDRGVGYSDPTAMAAWSKIYYQLEQHGKTVNWFKKNTAEFIEFARRLDTDYLIINSSIDDLPETEDCTELIHQNATYSIFKLNNICTRSD